MHRHAAFLRSIHRSVLLMLSWRITHRHADEPTNPLDMDMIDSLALAINAYSGGLVVVSHDFRLLEQVAETIWVCEHKTITPWKSDIQAYKKHLRKQMEADVKRMSTGGGVQ